LNENLKTHQYKTLLRKSHRLKNKNIKMHVHITPQVQKNG